MAERTPPKRIKDPIHDLITVSGPMMALVDHPLLQRLRSIRQTGTAHLVYPGANHTRFEHSLGAHHLSQVASQALALDEGEASLVGAAALLHDIGHGPFSHLSEVVIRALTGRSHEDATASLVQDGLAAVLDEQGIAPRDVVRLIRGPHRLKGLVSSAIDVDRIDYLLRDGHYTGVATSVDALRLVHTVRFVNDRLVITRDGLGAAESLLLTRFAMQSAVYYHHTCRAGELLLERALFALIEGGSVSADEVARMDDAELITRLRSDAGEAGLLARRVLERRLSKVALEIPYRALEDRWVKANSGNVTKLIELEHEIAARAGVPARHVQVDAPSPPRLPEMEAHVLLDDGEVRPLSEVSTLVRALAQAHQDHWHFRVYAPAESLDTVAKAAPGELALEKRLDKF